MERPLSELLKLWRAERPDEWTMDEFIREAQRMEKMIAQKSPNTGNKQCQTCNNERNNADCLICPVCNHENEPEYNFKRLVALNSMGIYIAHESGHRYICYNEEHEFHPFKDKLKSEGIILNSKSYGTVVDVLDTIDYCLDMVGFSGLAECYETLSLEGIGHSASHNTNSRITMSDPGHGGIF